MKTFFKWLGISLGIVILLIMLMFAAMRFHDGPRGRLSGGPFKTGEPSSIPASWSFMKEAMLTEFQTLVPETSRTVWFGVYQGRLFIVSGYMNTLTGKIWKHWPHNLEEDNRIVLRHDGKLYELKLERQMQGEHLQGVLNEFGRKYGFSATPEVVANGDAWLYEAQARDD